MRGPLRRLGRCPPSASTTQGEEQARPVQSDNQCQTELQPFTYDSLPDPQNNIRLIEIHPGADDEVVSCTLTTWHISEAGSSEDSYPDSKADNTSPTSIQVTDRSPNGENSSGNTSPRTPASSGSTAQRKHRSSGASRKEASLPSAPSYYAISYTWGDPQDMALIHVNGQEMTVRKNCEYVLRQARWCGKGRFFWVDAICINQGDMDEKSHQVAMMGNTFTKAILVMACVGPHHDDSEMLLQTLAKHQSLFYMASLNEIQDRFFSMVRRWRLTTRGTTIVRLFRAVLSLYRRQYFTRLWIFQELYLAHSRIILCCGEAHQPLALAFGLRSILARELFVQEGDEIKGWTDHSCPISGLTFQNWAMCLYQEIRKKFTWRRWYPVRKSDSSRLLSSYMDFLETEQYRGWHVCLDAYQKEPVFAMLCELLTAENDMLRPKDFGELLSLPTHLNCEDPRDKIYGILSVADWKAPGLILPDYTITPFQLALRILTSEILVDRFPDDQSSGEPVLLRIAQRIQRTTWALIRSLGLLSLEDCQEMKGALSRRKYDPIQQPNQVEQGDSHEPSDLVKAGLMALQIPPALAIDPSSSAMEWEFADEAGSTILVTYLPNKPGDLHTDLVDRKTIICLPTRAQAGDWILVWDHTTGVFRPEAGLLARKQHDSECYSILGHATISATYFDTPRYTTSFRLEFSPEDYLVYVAQTYFLISEDAQAYHSRWINLPKLRDLLNSHFCGAPQSSIARLVLEKSRAHQD